MEENCARARRIAKLPIVSINTFGRTDDFSVARRRASKSLAARAVGIDATAPSCASCLQPQFASVGLLNLVACKFCEVRELVCAEERLFAARQRLGDVSLMSLGALPGFCLL